MPTMAARGCAMFFLTVVVGLVSSALPTSDAPRHTRSSRGGSCCFAILAALPVPGGTEQKTNATEMRLETTHVVNNSFCKKGQGSPFHRHNAFPSFLVWPVSS